MSFCRWHWERIIPSCITDICECCQDHFYCDFLPLIFFFCPIVRSFGIICLNLIMKLQKQLIKSWWQIYVQRYTTFFHFASQGCHEKMFSHLLGSTMMTHSVSSLAPRENVCLGQYNKSKLVLLLGEGRSLHEELKAECLHSQPWPGW